jgi:predicted nucleic acid-binding protein
MIIVDTTVWIEFLRGRQPYLDHVSGLLAKNEVLTLSPIFGELLQGARNNAERQLIVSFWNSLPKAAEGGLFVRAGDESGRNKWMDKGVGLIDAAIVTAARESASFVWSLDAKLLRILRLDEKYSIA